MDWIFFLSGFALGAFSGFLFAWEWRSTEVHEARMAAHFARSDRDTWRLAYQRRTPTPPTEREE